MENYRGKYPIWTAHVHTQLHTYISTCIKYIHTNIHRDGHTQKHTQRWTNTDKQNHTEKQGHTNKQTHLDTTNSHIHTLPPPAPVIYLLKSILKVYLKTETWIFL